MRASFPFRRRKPFLPLLGETFELVDDSKKLKSLIEMVSYEPPIVVMHSFNDHAELNLKITMKPEFKETYFVNCTKDDI